MIVIPRTIAIAIIIIIIITITIIIITIVLKEGLEEVSDPVGGMKTQSQRIAAIILLLLLVVIVIIVIIGIIDMADGLLIKVN